ncbi:hypothetical protein BZG36_02040 [Bifiguratus adelaidae]|uniref:Uncharacterized protein n=1 Tax=Bifiguratus adelaidae TaxID=1938954 RepID=A0A261Y202_9FUNG|nr:hypothetical protein BZG36_02040 [Bifiguratus adelaidae]
MAQVMARQIASKIWDSSENLFKEENLAPKRTLSLINLKKSPKAPGSKDKIVRNATVADLRSLSPDSNNSGDTDLARKYSLRETYLQDLSNGQPSRTPSATGSSCSSESSSTLHSASVNEKHRLDHSPWEDLFLPNATVNGLNDEIKIFLRSPNVHRSQLTAPSLANINAWDRGTSHLSRSSSLRKPVPIQLAMMPYSTQDIQEGDEGSDADTIIERPDYDPYHVLYKIKFDQRCSRETQISADDLSVISVPTREQATLNTCQAEPRRKTSVRFKLYRAAHHSHKWMQQAPRGQLLFYVGFLFPPAWIIGSHLKGQLATEEDAFWKRRCRWAMTISFVVLACILVVVFILHQSIFHVQG